MPVNKDLEQNHLSQLAYVYDKPMCEGLIKASPEDFQVSENLSFDLERQGNHAYLYLQKQNLNTITVAKRLETIANTKQVAIGYAGLKDKNALTSQWFSVDLSGKPEPDWSQIEDQNLKVIDITRHSRKLRRGAIAYNRFKINVRDLQGDLEELKQRLPKISETGVPNYFGSQRFGHNEQNLAYAVELFSSKTINGKKGSKNRFLQGLYISSARSMLFNKVLSYRVKNDTWNCAMHGDAMLLDGSNSYFVVDEVDQSVVQRVEEKDIHPTGPLYGLGKLATTHQIANIENQILSDNPLFLSGLEKFKAKMGRRSLRLDVKSMRWQLFEQDNQQRLELQFDLASGSYATSVLRELIVLL